LTELEFEHLKKQVQCRMSIIKHRFGRECPYLIKPWIAGHIPRYLKFVADPKFRS